LSVALLHITDDNQLVYFFLMIFNTSLLFISMSKLIYILWATWTSYRQGLLHFLCRFIKLGRIHCPLLLFAILFKPLEKFWTCKGMCTLCLCISETQSNIYFHLSVNFVRHNLSFDIVCSCQPFPHFLSVLQLQTLGRLSVRALN
jgi:hypothetical protein